MQELSGGTGSEPMVDRREAEPPLAVRFLARRATDRPSGAALALHDCGVLAATTAFGKTVVAAVLIARRGRNTLVLVHRRQLVERGERLRAFLSLEAATSAHRRRQAEAERPDRRGADPIAWAGGPVSDLIAGHGHLVVDEFTTSRRSAFEPGGPPLQGPLRARALTLSRGGMASADHLMQAGRCGRWMPVDRPYAGPRAPGAGCGKLPPGYRRDKRAISTFRCRPFTPR